MSAILLENKIVHYEVLGRGRPLLFIHGWVGSWRYWVPVMQAASTAFRAYALDLWGFGDTAKPGYGYGLLQQVGLVEKFIAQMGISRVALVGHGIGAVVAVLYALQAASRVDRLMLVAYPFGPDKLSARLRSTPQDELMSWLLQRSQDTEPIFQDAARADSRAVTASLDELGSLELGSAWQTIAKPCLFVSGENDLLVSLSELESMPAWSHHVVMEGSGHYPMLDESSRFNRLLLDFLSLESSVSPQQLQLKEEWKRRVR